MADPLRDRLEGFLRWYHDLYGGSWYVENRAALEALLRGEAPAGDSALAQFQRQIQDCTRCPLGKSRTRFVFGSGSENAEIMLIGEAPGRDEDLQGQPFVGRSGQLLTKMLARIGLKRQEVYIANILKCRPPDNRNPAPLEVETCLPYLQRQIEMIQPKLLIALGKVAAQTLTGSEAGMAGLRGRLWQYRNIPLIVTFHPAYLLRNESALEDGVRDLQFALAQYQKNQPR